MFDRGILIFSWSIRTFQRPVVSDDDIFEEEDLNGDGREANISTRFIPLHGLLSSMSLEETVDYLAEELDLERSEHVREVGQSVAELRD